MLNLIPQRGRKTSPGRVRPGLEALEDRCVPSVAFLGTDATTQGSWMGKYGGDAYKIVGDADTTKGELKVTVSGAPTWVYANPTNDLRGLQKPAAPSTRIEAGWFNYVYGQPTADSFTVDIKLPSLSAAENVAFYLEDWDGGNNRVETVTATDPKNPGTPPVTATVSNFGNGVYLVFQQQGEVIYTFKKIAGPNAVLSAVFFDTPNTTPPPAPPAAGSAAWAGMDTNTQGNWSPTYGRDGNIIYGDPTGEHLPVYAQQVSTYGQSFGLHTFVDPNPTLDPRGLQVPGGRTAVAQYSTDRFTLDVNLTDYPTKHWLTLYAVDWDNVHRNEYFEVIDNTTGTVYDTRSLSNFSGGAYLSWEVSGHVQIRVTRDPSTNQTVLVQGMFFDPVNPLPPLFGGAMASLSSGSGVITVGPQNSTDTTAVFPARGLENGVDVVLLDRLFARARQFHHHDFGTLGLTEGIA